MTTIGIVAPSSAIPQIELERGVQHLTTLGFHLVIHPSVFSQYSYYAGEDAQRAQSILDFAFDDAIDAIWCARGGYGATHLLPLLKKATLRRKPKKKFILGYSDVTALLEFCKTQWNWRCVHAPMPAGKRFPEMKPEFEHFWVDLLRGEKQEYSVPLTSVYRPKTKSKKIEGKLCGGNLSVWTSLIGTPFQGNPRQKILFFEDLNETLPRIRRMLGQIDQSGGFKGVRAILLGEFTDCKDAIPMVFAAAPTPKKPEPELKPLRVKIDSRSGLHLNFSEIGAKYDIPVWSGVPTGHDLGDLALPFFTTATIDALGTLHLKTC